MNLSCRIANRAWLAACLPGALQYRRALRRPREIQERILLHILQRNAKCAFGRRHGFHAIHDSRAFRENVPLSSYEEYASWIEAARRGGRSCITEERIGAFTPTGGSTGGIKHIPHTQDLMRAFRRGIAPWVVDMHRRHSAMRDGSSYWSITPVGDAGVMGDDTSYLGGVMAPVVGRTLAVPPAQVRSLEGEPFWDETLHCLLAREDLSFISVWHPSFLERLLDRMTENWGNLLDRQTADRARVLKHCDPAALRAIWPKLRLVSCWGDGHAAAPCRSLAERMPGVDVQPKGLLATEAFVSLPYGGQHPLAVRCHFFEFLDPRGRSHLAHELVEGETYNVCVTTGGGLYRYQLHDEIVVDGFVDATPSIRFLGKVDAVSDLVGEKLTEAFVGACLREAFAENGIEPSFAMLAPDDTCCGYVLYVEALELPNTVADDVCSMLRGNPQYAYAVSLGQLAPVRLCRVASGGYASYTARLVDGGRRLGDIKAAALSKDAGWSQWLLPHGRNATVSRTMPVPRSTVFES